MRLMRLMLWHGCSLVLVRLQQRAAGGAAGAGRVRLRAAAAAGPLRMTWRCAWTPAAAAPALAARQRRRGRMVRGSRVRQGLRWGAAMALAAVQVGIVRHSSRGVWVSQWYKERRVLSAVRLMYIHTVHEQALPVRGTGAQLIGTDYIPLCYIQQHAAACMYANHHADGRCLQ